MQTRPLSLTIIGWLLIVLSLLSVIGLLSLMTPAAQQALAATGQSTMVAMIMGVVGVFVTIACGYGILKGFDWARVLYVGWNVVNIIYTIIAAPVTSFVLITVVVTLVVAYFLFRPEADAWFGKSYLKRG